jgi:hypothetical protein
MHAFARELRDDGYERTGRESPFDEDGELWTNSYELVCDKTGMVIRKDGGNKSSNEKEDTMVERHEYYNSGNTRMIGGYVSAYDWGHDGDSFSY